jgi:DNA replicative helicase MCM subunit Mcm2 (Cdc46/Mcm family)
MKKKLTKKQAEKIHFKKRVLERFDITINRHDIRELIEDIQAGNNIIKSERLSSRVTLHTMIFMKKRMNILYDRMRKVPITAKTMDMVSKNSIDYETEQIYT